MTTPTIPELPRAASPNSANPAANGANRATLPSLIGLGIDQLLELRATIDQALPARALKDLDLENELVIQLLATQELQRKVLNPGKEGEPTPANQLAQVSNAVQAALQNLVKMQGEVYKSERLKKLELALLRSITDLPFEVQNKFLTDYETLTEGL